MAEETFKIIDDDIAEKELKIKELEEKLKETENKLNELNKNLELRVIERTVEINRLLRHKIRFIDNLSHDLGTPLTPLITLLPLVKDDIKDNKNLTEIIDTCIRSAEYIKRVVHNARELAELSSKNLFLKDENLYDILNILLEKYQSIFKSCNILVENKISKEIVVKTEKNRLIQLFDQVISNAINSMPNGGKIAFEFKPLKKDEGTFIKISVTDTGIGLEKEQITHIFDEFYKTDDSRHKLDSTGLGLSICKSIVEKHGGKIWADSHGKGTGTTIFFTIPSSDIVYDRTFF